MTSMLKKTFMLICLLTFVSCINKSQFDTLHSPYYDLPWDFAITSVSSTLTTETVSWGNSSKAISYSVEHKDETDLNYTVDSVDATSPYTVSGLILGHTYLIKIIAKNAYGKKESDIVTQIITWPPIAIDVSPANIIAGASRTITLSYTAADGDLASSCNISSLTGLNATSACQCILGVCTVDVIGQSGYLGAAEFTYTVMANGQISDTAIVAFDYICPTGFVAINDNVTLGVAAFCIMQFEAKKVGGIATSQALLTPWNNLSMPSAKSNCQALGSQYDLISNPEWMTIAKGIDAGIYSLDLTADVDSLYSNTGFRCVYRP